jgi:hypothetical protein
MAMTNEERREYYRNNYAKHREELKAKRKERLNEIKHGETTD